MARDQLLEAKVVVLGTQGVGKTSLVLRFVQETYARSAHPTLGATFLTKKLNVDGTEVKFQIWDTAGQERFRSMTPMYYRGAHAAIIVYSITAEQSFIEVSSWIEELKRNMAGDLPIIHIVGTKLDLAGGQRKVHPALAAEYARTCIPPSSGSSPGRRSLATVGSAKKAAGPQANVGTAPYLPENFWRRRVSVQASHGPAPVGTDLPARAPFQFPHLANSITGNRVRSSSVSHFGDASPSHRTVRSPARLRDISSFHRRTSSLTTDQKSPDSADGPLSEGPLSFASISVVTPPPQRHRINIPPQFQFPALRKSPPLDCGPPPSPSAPTSRTVTPSPAPSVVTWSEVSSKENEGVQALFADLARRLVRQKESIQKSRKANLVSIDGTTEQSRDRKVASVARCCRI